MIKLPVFQIIWIVLFFSTVMQQVDLDEWIQQVRKTSFSLQSLLMQNIKEFCFVSIVKRGHLLLPNFLLMFWEIFKNLQK